MSSTTLDYDRNDWSSPPLHQVFAMEVKKREANKWLRRRLRDLPPPPEEQP